MGILSDLIRKSNRGETTQLEDDFLDQKEGIPIGPKAEQPSEMLVLLRLEAQEAKPCVDCEEHQKKPQRKRSKNVED